MIRVPSNDLEKKKVIQTKRMWKRVGVGVGGLQGRGSNPHISWPYIYCVDMLMSHLGTSEKRGLHNLQILQNVLLIILRD